jgi:multiple sugar transport system substrate-binding protein
VELKKLARRDFLRLSAAGTAGAILAGCQPAAPQVVEVEKQVPVEKQVIQTVEVEKVVTAAPQPKEQITLVFSDWGAANNQKMWEEVSPIFFETHPNVKVTYRLDVGGFEKLLASMVAGTAPDVYNAWGPYVIRFREREQALELTPYVDKDISEEDVNDWNPAQLPAFQWEDKWYALPTYCGASCIYCNLDMFREAGLDDPPKEWGEASWTHDEYLEVLRALTKKDASGKVVHFGGYEPHNASNWQWPQMHLNAYGGHYVDPDDNTRCALGDPEAQEAANWLYSALWEENVLPQAGQLAELSYVQYWMAEGSAMSWGGGWNLGQVVEGTRFNWNLTPMARGPVKQTTIVTTDAYLGWAHSKYLDATWELLKFVSSETYGKALARAYYLAQPARRSLLPYWYKIMRMEHPALEKVDLELMGKCFELGLGDITETFLRNEEAREIIIPAWDEIFDLGEGTPADLAAVCDEVTAQQRELAGS